ncbi:hypothetical protein F8388_011364 [Cannabis sativa]|uniref:Pentatricopeptide repeat-containing protein n=1 Tax=Cannabis sativa TaxID=3483 RepID=A0A7J6EVS6_CANSA|nr:hypothetical protein F8388_011364 [Cannabis sativa]
MKKLRRVTPELVANVLKVQTEPALASKFFHWAGSLQSNVNRVDKAHKLFLGPNSETFNPIVVSYAEMKKMDEFCELLVQMKKLGSSVMDDFAKFWQWKCLRTGKSEVIIVYILAVVSEMMQERCPPDDVVCSAVIFGMCKHDVIEEARKSVAFGVIKGAAHDAIKFWENGWKRGKRKLMIRPSSKVSIIAMKKHATCTKIMVLTLDLDLPKWLYAEEFAGRLL